MSKLKQRLLDKIKIIVTETVTKKKSPGFAAVKFRTQVHSFMTKITVRLVRFVNAVEVKIEIRVAVR